MQHLFVGLGNPGKKYERTRHNIGFMVLKELAASLGWDFKEKKPFHAWIAKGEVEGKTIHLLMPATYMNESGIAVCRYMEQTHLEPKDLLVVVDDIALPYGDMRLRSKGSAGGHNGLKSLEAYLGTQQYARLRMGVGHQGPMDLADYVLDNFSLEEQKTLSEYIQRGAQTLKQLMNESITHVMKTVNTKSKN
jgi:peptidyl-tRNA hydrolase, PTH1 family